MQAHLDGAQRKLQQAGNFIGSKPVSVVKQKNCLVHIGKVGNVPLHARTHLLLLDDGQWRWPIFVNNRQLFHWGVHLPLNYPHPLPQAIDADMSSNLVEPAGQRCWVTQRAALSMSTHEGFLCEVFRIRRISNKTTDLSGHA